MEIIGELTLSTPNAPVINDRFWEAKLKPLERYQIFRAMRSYFIWRRLYHSNAY
jgi:hypothetical protein